MAPEPVKSTHRPSHGCPGLARLVALTVALLCSPALAGDYRREHTYDTTAGPEAKKALQELAKEAPFPAARQEATEALARHPTHTPQASPKANPHTVPVDFHAMVVDKRDRLTLPRSFQVFYGMLGHSNGKVYVGTNYNVARLAEFDPATRRCKVVAVMSSRASRGGPKLEEPTLHGDLGTGQFPRNRWNLAQDKIHAQLHQGRDGRVYGATHTSVEHIDKTLSYPGGHWFAYDPKTGKTEDLGWSRRHEGIITCCMDRQRNVLYGISWPTGYLFRCRPSKKAYSERLSVLGLACSQVDCTPRYMDVAANGRVYLCDGATGDVRVYDPRLNRLLSIPGLATPAGETPKAEVKGLVGTLRATRRWRNWWMCGTRSPDGMHIFFTSQRGGHLVEIDATQGRWGVIVDHGHMDPGRPAAWAGPWSALMVFGRDGLLYHTVNRQLLTFDPKRGRVLDWGRVVLRSDQSVTLRLRGGGVLGKNGRIYCVAKHRKQVGIVVLDPAQLKRGKPVLSRISPRRAIRPTGTTK